MRLHQQLDRIANAVTSIHTPSRFTIRFRIGPIRLPLTIEVDLEGAGE